MVENFARAQLWSLNALNLEDDRSHSVSTAIYREVGLFEEWEVTPIPQSPDIMVKVLPSGLTESFRHPEGLINMNNLSIVED